MGNANLPPGRQITRRQALALGASSIAAWACTTREQPAPVPDRPNIVVYLADSLRRDHLGCYGYGPRTTPSIDRFSSEACVFDRCYSAASWTKPSIASLFTGVLPRVHHAGLAGAWNELSGDVPVQVLRPAFPTLAQQLKAAGYQTAWFLASPVVESQYGFARGVDYYHYCEQEPPSEQALLIMQWLRREAKEPFFLFIHAIDPHYPYVAPNDAFERLHGMSREDYLASLAGPEGDLLRSYVQEHGNVFNLPGIERTSFYGLSRKGLALLNGLYDAEIAHIDHQFGRILSTMRGRDLLERSITVFTSDHGEAFGEHGFFYHAHIPFEHQIRVPLVIRLPGPPRPLRVPYTVSQCDLNATLLRLAGARTPAFVRGDSYFDVQCNLAVHGHRAVHSDYDRNNIRTDAWASCLIQGDLKVMSSPGNDGVHAFDLTQDPGEMDDLMAGSRGQSREIQSLIERFFDEWTRDIDLARAFGEPEWTMAGHENRQALEALGYL